MKGLIAAILTLIGIVLLFRMVGSTREKLSWALWAPTLWLLLVSSRPLGSWLQYGTHTTIEAGLEEGSPYDALFYGFLTLFGLYVLLGRSLWVRRCIRDNWALLLFFVYCAISVWWSDFPFVAFKRWIKFFGQIEMIWILLSEPSPTLALQIVFRRMAFVLLPISILLIKMYPALGRIYTNQGGLEWVGVSTQKNGLGATSMVCSLGMVWLLLISWKDRPGKRGRQERIAYGLSLALSVYLCHESQSVTSQVCLVIGLSIMIAVSTRYLRRRPSLVPWIVIGACSVTVFALFIDQSGVFVHALGRRQDLTDRTDIWRAVLQEKINPIFGAGYESFWMGARLERVQAKVGTIAQAHNAYLETYLNLGWTGIVLLLMIIFSGMRRNLALLRTNLEMARLTVPLLTVAIIYGVSEAGFRVPSLTSILLLLPVACSAVTVGRTAKIRKNASDPTTVRVPASVRPLSRGSARAFSEYS